MGTCRYYYTNGTKSLRPSAEGGSSKTVSETMTFRTGHLGERGTDIQVPLSFSGTEEDVTRAIVIAAVGIGNLLEKARLTGNSLDHPNMSAVDRKNADYIEGIVGKGATRDQWIQYVLDNNKFAQNLMKTTNAKDVIAKYGDRVKADPDITGALSSPTIDRIRGDRRAKAEAAIAERRTSLSQKGYYKSGSTVEVRSKLPSDLSGVTEIVGKTYDHRAEIKAAGFRWNGEKWVKK